MRLRPSLDFWLLLAIATLIVVVAAFFFDREGNPVGYVVWAHLAPDSEKRLLTDPGFLLHPSEWNEGGKTWIIDFCFPAGGAKESIVQLKNFFRGEEIQKVFWARRDKNHVVRKLLSYSL